MKKLALVVSHWSVGLKAEPAYVSGFGATAGASLEYSINPFVGFGLEGTNFMKSDGLQGLGYGSLNLSKEVRFDADWKQLRQKVRKNRCNAFFVTDRAGSLADFEFAVGEVSFKYTEFGAAFAEKGAEFVERGTGVFGLDDGLGELVVNEAGGRETLQ